MDEHPFGFSRSVDVDEAGPPQPGPPPPTSSAEWPWSYYAGLIRLASRFGITPPVLWDMHEWEIAALIGADLVDHQGVSVSEKGSVRRQHAERAAKLQNLPADVAEDRQERLKSRKARRAAQRADPAWQAQVKANQGTQGVRQSVPGAVIPDGEVIVHRVGG